MAAYLAAFRVCLPASQDYMAPEVLICPDKRRPEENKDKVLLAYTAQVRSQGLTSGVWLTV